MQRSYWRKPKVFSAVHAEYGGLDYLTADSALSEARKVRVVVRVRGPRLGGRQVRVEVQSGDVVLQQLADSERKIVVPEKAKKT